MSHNSFGHLFRVTTFGESHGPVIGCVVDGCPPNITIDERELQVWLDQRRPGQSQFVTQRREADRVEILSGTILQNGARISTGTPILLLIRNEDARSQDYSQIADSFRPGHADYTYWAKYGLRDVAGGGRASARETAARVAAGGIARLILRELYGADLHIRGGVVELGGDAVDRSRLDWSHCADNPFFSPDPNAIARWEALLLAARKAGSSLGAIVEVQAQGVPAGLGAPIYGKLDADLAAAMMSINAVKGVEIGSGFALARLRGEEAADEMSLEHRLIERNPSDPGPMLQTIEMEHDPIDCESGRSDHAPDPTDSVGDTPRHPVFSSNHNGGILGGISSGQDIVVRMAIKPTSSILIPRQSLDRFGKRVEVSTKGRHDPCVGIRAVPVAEAMLACVLADHALRHRGQTGQSGPIGHF